MISRRRLMANAIALALGACGAPPSSPDAAPGSSTLASPQITIAAAAARTAGIGVEQAGPGAIQETVNLVGRISFQPNARTEVRAPYSGPIRSVARNFGDQVRRGEMLARVESSESLQTYSVTAPLAGTVLERNANVGDITADRALFVIGDLSKLEAEFYVFPRDAARVRTGQPVVLLGGADNTARIETRIASLLPAAQDNMQAMIARAPFSAGANMLRPGMSIRASIVIAESQAPIVVASEALQRLGDDEVVFVQRGDTYTPRTLRIGRRSGDRVEVLGGLQAGELYVAHNAFVLKSQLLGAAGANEE